MFAKVYRKGYLNHICTNTQEGKQWLGTHVYQYMVNVLINTEKNLVQSYLHIRVLEDTNFPRYELGNIHYMSCNHLVKPSHH